VGPAWQTFQEYDSNQDQSVDREEYVNGCRRRTAVYKAKIDEQYAKLVPKDAEASVLEQVRVQERRRVGGERSA
jgi:hypothetical protein